MSQSEPIFNHRSLSLVVAGWAVKKNNPERMKVILFTICEQIKNISILLNPIIPDSTLKVLGIFNLKQNKRNFYHQD